MQAPECRVAECLEDSRLLLPTFVYSIDTSCYTVIAANCLGDILWVLCALHFACVLDSVTDVNRRRSRTLID